MPRLARNIVHVIGCLLFIAVLAGCATYDRNVTLLYRPVANAAGGSGDLYLAPAGARPGPGEPGNVKWVIGKVKNTDGEETGDIVSPIAPNDLILDAFDRELTIAGYRVRQLKAVPENAPKGIEVVMPNISLEEIAGIMKAEGKCRLTLSIDLWKNGKKFKKLHFESSYSDVAVKDRDLLLQTVLQKGLQGLMKQAVPEIVKNLGS